MIIVGLNYITQTFTYIRVAVVEGYIWLETILEALGFSLAGLIAVIVGFACVGYVVTQAMGYFRGDRADSVVTRKGSQELHDRAFEANHPHRKVGF